MVSKNQDRGDAGRLTKTIKWIRIVVAAVAIVGLGAYIVVLNLGAAEASKPIGH